MLKARKSDEDSPREYRNLIPEAKVGVLHVQVVEVRESEKQSGGDTIEKIHSTFHTNTDRCFDSRL